MYGVVMIALITNIAYQDAERSEDERLNKQRKVIKQDSNRMPL